MRVLLELIRIIFIFLFLGAISSGIINYIYTKLGTDMNSYGWMGVIAIFILLFVLYRNKLQFSGWYKGKGRVKLSEKVFKLLIFSSVSLLLLPPILSFFFK
ncbi:hypothetical protein BN000_03079 [Neobacillus massiliamazoniensis]|uniref:Uncharacterized protein n=1 Tax=Neobacillus massiliamazoniensis TaxID=1499688 RepID=A0A0U1NYL3_9BACI|nr:hypothetical protein BN000_03079 [Neobacillus massiliamazoniensis]